MRGFLFLLACVCSFIGAHADNYQPVNEGPVHEAFIVNEAGSLLLQAITVAPPAKITELIPQQTDPQAVWIPGYWAWIPTHQVYLWVSGVWRRPPPGLRWIPGAWKNYPQGWVYISGFWSATDADQLTYLAIPPPDAIDEMVPTPPATTGYFWVPGCWQYDKQLRQYIWFSGRWESIDPKWVYCPAHYVWRETGYAFVAGFWDWNLETRGTAFASIVIDPSALESLVYEPKDRLSHLFIMENFFPFWPDYSCLFQHHYYSNHDAWVAWGAVPPWWNWPTWWCFSRTAQWGLWWWWTHPGYPQPTWLTTTLAQSIPPPRSFVVSMMQRVKAPPFVTSSGIVGMHQMFESLSGQSGNNLPILPADTKQVEAIHKETTPETPERPYLEPTAPSPQMQGPAKPFFGPPKNSLKVEPERVTLPVRPAIAAVGKGVDPAVAQETPAAVQGDVAQGPPPMEGSHPVHQTLPTPPRPHGFIFTQTEPYHAMQTEHHNYFMTNRHPQINPEGPQVYPRPTYMSPHISEGQY